jgi:hypothetical protein
MNRTISVAAVIVSGVAFAAGWRAVALRASTPSAALGIISNDGGGAGAGETDGEHNNTSGGAAGQGVDVTRVFSLEGILGQTLEGRVTTADDVTGALMAMFGPGDPPILTFIESEGIVTITGTLRHTQAAESLLTMMREARARERVTTQESLQSSAVYRSALAQAQRTLTAAMARETSLKRVAALARDEGVPESLQAWYEAAAADAGAFVIEAQARAEEIAASQPGDALPAPLSMPVLAALPESARLNALIEKSKQESAALTAKIDELVAAVRERDGLLAQRDTYIQSRDTALRDTTLSLDQHAQSLNDLTRTLRDRDRTLHDVTYRLETLTREDQRHHARIDDLCRDLEREKRARRDAEHRAHELQRRLNRYIPGQPSQQPPDPHNGNMGPFPR